MSIEQELQKLYGVGPVLAANIIHNLQAQGDINPKQNYNHETLRRILKNNPLFLGLPISTKIDLKCNPIKEIPRDFIKIIDEELHKYIKNIRFNIAGSYRRKKPMSRDIDIVIINDKSQKNQNIRNQKNQNIRNQNLDKIISTINIKSKRIKICKPFARGTEKATLLFEVIIPQALQYYLAKYYQRQIIKVKLPNNKIIKKVRVKVDIFLTEEREYIFALLFATGSGTFNVRMRAVAKRKGYLLNHKGIYKKNGVQLRRLPISKEEDIFKLLNMKYRNPEDRII